MTDRKIHILFRGKTKQSGEIQRRELLWLLNNIKKNEGEKRKKCEKKLENWIEAHSFIQEQIMNQGVESGNVVDKLLNHMGRTDVFYPGRVRAKITNELTKYFGDKVIR